MTLSPVPFLRIGFIILGVALALAFWTANGGLASWWQVGAGAASLVIALVGGEVAVRLACASRPSADDCPE